MDGSIQSGQTSVNQAVMTSQSLPVDKGIGDEVSSGTAYRTRYAGRCEQKKFLGGYKDLLSENCISIPEQVKKDDSGSVIVIINSVFLLQWRKNQKSVGYSSLNI